MRLDIEALLERMVSASYVWGPSLTFVQLKAMVDLLSRRRISLHGKTCVDFGCGATRPLSVAALMYLLGADSTLSVDTATAANEDHVAVGIYALILAALSGRMGVDTTRVGVTPRALRDRCAGFDLAKLLKGDLRGMPASVQRRTGDYLELPLPERGFDFLTSYSVLEHVQDLPSYLHGFRASISEGGAIFIAIDYRDHRCYTVQASKWQYLLDDGDHVPGYINKVRHSELVHLIGEARFAIAETKIVHQDPSQQELAAFLPRYRDMTREDITVTEAHLLLLPL